MFTQQKIALQHNIKAYMNGFKANSADREYMELAISEQSRCDNTPKIGAVIVTAMGQIITGFRHDILEGEWEGDFFV